VLICSLILGRKGSQGFPGKNLLEIDGRPLAWYPMEAARRCELISDHFISTDDPLLVSLGEKQCFEIIERPPELATVDALGEDAFYHGFQVICDRLGSRPDIVVLLLCNSPTVSTDMITKGIELLENHPEADSVVSVSRYNMYGPVRARLLNDDGFLDPYLPLAMHPNSSSVSCDRDAQGDIWFADMGVSIVRSRCFEDMDSNIFPQKWMGSKILPIYSEAGLDLDYDWQIGQAEWWIKKHF